MGQLLWPWARLSNLLSLAAIVLFAIHATNIENVGVHLSFLAVATIGIFVVSTKGQEDDEPDNALQSFLRKNAGAVRRFSDLALKWLSGMLRLSFWVWLITSPLVWCHFHVVAPIAVPLNVAVSIPLGFGLLGGLITGLLGGWVPWIGTIAGGVCGTSLDVICWLVDIGERVPGGHYWLPSPPLWWSVVFYGLAVVWLCVFQRAR